MSCFNLFPTEGHVYAFASVGLPRRVCERTFSSRAEANEYMYKVCAKYGLRIVEVYDDRHDKTYKCDNGVNFYIHRM